MEAQALEMAPRLRGSRTGADVARDALLQREQVSRLVNYAHTRFGIAAADAEDVLQEALFEIAGSETFVRSPRAYVFRVFHNHCAEFVERKISRREVPVPTNLRLAAADTSGGVDLDSWLTVKQGLASLSVTCRTLLVAHYLEGRTLKDAAGEVNLSTKTVWKRLTRCLEKLRELVTA
jgi:RNA polymerase sigma factor (sigma-70 family)